MLLGSFFTIADRTTTGTTFVATIDINALHPIFEGHFPGNPVVPGVCMVQMIKEILETIFEKKMQLKKADQLKFLAIINPLENPSVQVECSFDKKDDALITASGRIFKAETTFLKFKTAFIYT